MGCLLFSFRLRILLYLQQGQLQEALLSQFLTAGSAASREYLHLSRHSILSSASCISLSKEIHGSSDSSQTAGTVSNWIWNSSSQAALLSFSSTTDPLLSVYLPEVQPLFIRKEGKIKFSFPFRLHLVFLFFFCF